MADELEKSTEQRSVVESKDELLAKLSAQLGPEEIVLWAEMVVPDRKSAMLIRVFAIASSAILLLMTSSVFIVNRRQTTVSIVVEIIFAFYAFRIARDFFKHQNFSLRNRVAVLTNLRAIEVDSNNCSTLVWYSSPNFEPVESVQTKTGLGNLLFVSDEELYRYGFTNVPNTAEAAEILFRAQEANRGDRRLN